MLSRARGMMPQFTSRAARPMTPAAYRRAAQEVRRYADQIEASTDPQTTQDKRRLSIAISGLSRYARLLFRRHSGLQLIDR